jgi:hypothetical protein
MVTSASLSEATRGNPTRPSRQPLLRHPLPPPSLEEAVGRRTAAAGGPLFLVFPSALAASSFPHLSKIWRIRWCKLSPVWITGCGVSLFVLWSARSPTPTSRCRRPCIWMGRRRLMARTSVPTRWPGPDLKGQPHARKVCLRSAAMYRASARSSTDLAADHTGIFQGRWDAYVGELYGSFSRQGENLPDVCLYRFGRSDVFRKAPPVNFTGCVMPGDCWIGWVSVRYIRVFIWPFGFRGSAMKLCWLLPSCDTTSRSMVKSASGEYYWCRVLGTSNGDSSLCGNEKLSSWFVTRSSGMESGGDNIWEVQGPTLQDENPRSGLSWLCLAMSLLKTLFCECGLFSKVKT